MARKKKEHQGSMGLTTSHWVIELYVVVELLSHVRLFATPQAAACQASLSFAISQSLLKFRVHWVGDAIHQISSSGPPFPPALNLAQHQGLFQWVSSLNHVAKVLELRLQHQSFQWLFRVYFLWGGHEKPLQYSCLENSTDRRAWWATVHGIAKSHMTE